jgi:cytochrome c oxidase assembly factor CtaG
MCGGLGSYSAALLSAEVARLLVMALVVPALLTGGAPVALAVTLAGTSGPGSRWGRWVSPVNGLAALVLVLAAALMSPLLEASLRAPALHTLLAVTVMLAGWAFLHPLLQVDWTPAPRPDSHDARLLVGVLAVLLLVQAGHIWVSPALFASDWFLALSWPWVDVRADQHRAGLVAAGFALATLLVLPWVGRRSAPAFPQEQGVR